MEMLPEDVDFKTIPKYCVQRACPLVCVNQDIVNTQALVGLLTDPCSVQVNAIKPIFQDREMEETQQKNSNVLSYRRSISVSESLKGIRS